MFSSSRSGNGAKARVEFSVHTPSNYQAWVAVEGGDSDFTSRMKKEMGADLPVSGAVRIAGSANYKRKYAPTFPMVTIEEVHPGRMMTRAELEGRGLVGCPSHFVTN